MLAQYRLLLNICRLKSEILPYHRNVFLPINFVERYYFTGLAKAEASRLFVDNERTRSDLDHF